MMSPDHIWHSPIWPDGMSLYMVIVTFGDVAFDQRGELVADHLQIVGRRGVDVGDALLQQHHRHGGVPVVDDRGLVLVGGVPERLVRVLQRADVAGTWSLRQPIPVV